MRQEAVVSPVSPGAGRFQDWMWPDPQAYGGINIGTGVRQRNGLGAAAVATTTALGGGTAPIAAVIAGVECAQILSAAAGPAGVAFRFVNAGLSHIKTSKSNINPIADDQACKRFLINMAGGGIAIGAGDFGFQVTRNSAGAGRIVGDANDGFGLQIQNGNVINFIVRGPNGLIAPVALTGAPFDTTAWHTYDFLIIDATSTNEASLSLKIDNVPVALPALSASWAIGTNLPPAALTGGLVGFTPVVVSDSKNNNGFFVQQLRMITAPTSDALF